MTRDEMLEVLQDYAKEQLDELHADPQAYIDQNSNMSHVNDEHIDATDITMLNNVLTGRKYGDTRFLNDTTMYQAIAYALDDKMDEIADFVLNSMDDEMVIEWSDPNKIPVIGTGFLAESKKKENVLQYNQRIRTIQTSCLGLVLKRTDDTMAGFTIKSAFPAAHPTDPMLRHDAIKSTRKDITPLLVNTNFYRSRHNSEVTKLAARAACNDPMFESFRVDYRKEVYPDYPEQLFVTRESDTGKYGADCCILSYQDNDKVRTTFCGVNFADITNDGLTQKAVKTEYRPRASVTSRDPDFVIFADALATEMELGQKPPARLAVSFGTPRRGPTKPSASPPGRTHVAATTVTDEHQYT